MLSRQLMNPSELKIVENKKQPCVDILTNKTEMMFNSIQNSTHLIFTLIFKRHNKIYLLYCLSKFY